MGVVMLLPSGPSNAKLMIALDCASPRDLYSNTILSDREFDRMLDEAGGNRSACFVTALIREQVYGQSFDNQVALSKKAVTPNHVPLHDRMVLPCVQRGLGSLLRDIELVRPDVILALGNGVLFALTGKWGIKSWRGSILEFTTPSGHKCLVVPTWHPSYVQAVWKDRNIIVHDIRKAWNLAHAEELIQPPKYDFIIEPSFGVAASTLRTLIQRADTGPLKLAVDVETRGGHLACTGIAWSELEAICIPHLRAVVSEQLDWQQRIHYWNEVEEAFLVHLMFKLLTHPNVEVIGQNFIYDAQYFHRWLMFVPRFKRDTMIAQHSIFSSMQKGLDFLSSMYTKHHTYWKDESKNWDPKLGERQLWIYNCKDCCVTYEVDESQQKFIDAFAPTWPKLREVHDFQQSLFWPVLDTMNTGLRVDNSAKGSLSEELQKAIDERNAWIEEVVGYPLNIKSPVQMQDLFYRLLNQKKIINRKSGTATCDDAAMEKIGAREPLLKPLCDKVRELRSLGVFRSTFLEAPVDTDQRMRCSFNITGTETYRFSSSENAFGSGMNLQNIPSGNEESGLPNIRKLFICDDEMEYFDIDLDSADARIVVKESGCVKMQKWFDEGKKPYVEVAKEYFQDPSITKEHDAYKAFKVICHGTNYGGGAGEISQRMPKSAKVADLTEARITAIQKWYLEDMFPEIADWQKRVEDSVRTKRYVENVFGYRIWFFDRMEGTIFKQAIAAIPQSTVACLINRGYRNIFENEPNIKILLQVHDSLAGQYPIADREHCLDKIIRHCSTPLPYSSGPLVIPVGVKTSTLSWGHCG
jgi:DNA polymerase I-like protein with 3'-5' exonuclease and polymerase domains/uracil-DNA glycosylase